MHPEPPPLSPPLRIPGRAPAATGALAAALVALAAGPPAAAQEEGPTVVNPRGELKWLGFQSFDTAIVFEYRGTLDEREQSDGARTRNIEHRFEETLEIDTSGYAGHPNLFSFDLSGRFGLAQDIFEFSGEDGTTEQNEDRYEYDARGTFLQERELPVTLYSRLAQNTIDREFAASLDNTVSEHGIVLDWKHERFPVRATAYLRNEQQEDRAAAEGFEIDQRTVALEGRGQFTPSSELLWDFTYDDIDESGELVLPQTFERIEANVTHTATFGDDDRNTLRSYAHHSEQTGAFPRDSTRVYENLRLRLTEDLELWSDLRAERLEQAGQRQDTRSLSATMRHQLFESLTTLGRIEMSRFEIPDEDYVDQQSTYELSFDYVKKVGPGRLQIAPGVNFNRSTRTDRGTPIQVPDRTFVFGPSDLITINEANVEPSSIRITDLAGLILYQEDVDYRVRAFPDRVEIRRLLGGNIAAGQAVRIDYVVGPQPGGQIETTSYGITARYALEEGGLAGLAWYVRYLKQLQTRSFDAPEELFPSDEFTTMVLGTEYERGPLFARLEFEDRDTVLSPSETWRSEVRLSWRLARGTNAFLSAQYEDIDQYEDDLRIRTASFSASLSQRFDTRLSGSLTLNYRTLEESTGDDSQGFSQEIGLNWRYGRTEVYAEFRNSILDTNEDDTLTQRLFFGLRREF